MKDFLKFFLYKDSMECWVLCGFDYCWYWFVLMWKIIFIFWLIYKNLVLYEIEGEIVFFDRWVNIIDIFILCCIVYYIYSGVFNYFILIDNIWVIIYYYFLRIIKEWFVWGLMILIICWCGFYFFIFFRIEIRIC